MRRTVLYIDDNASNTLLMEHILARRPQLHLLISMQGGLGLELARHHLPDLILLDLHLPDLSGSEILQRLREDPHTAEIPVVMISADATPAQMDRIQELGLRAFLTKPIDVRELLRTVDEILVDPAGDH